MKNLLPILIFFSLFASAQQTTTVKVPPSKDTSIIKFTTTTVTSANTSTSFTITNKVVDSVPNQPPPPPPDNTGYTLVYSTGYDVIGDIINSHNQQGNGGLSTSVFKTGPGSFKSVPTNVSSGIRSEVQYDGAQTPLEGRLEYDVMFEVVPQGSCHSLQFHPSTSGGSASPGLWHENGKFSLVNWKSGTNTKYQTGFTIPKNQWMHIALDYKFGSSGYLKFSVDGNVLVDKTNIQVGDGSSPYLKVGVNMWVNQTSIAYYDNLFIYRKN